jgi:predicted dehydrogenase
MSAPLSLAIIGAGRIAGGYDRDRRAGEEGVYSHAGAAKAQGGIALKTVFDPDPERAGAFCQDWQVPEAASAWSKILAGSHDIVSLCTPDQTHYPLLCDLMQARCCKTILAEKPLALHRDEIAHLAALAEETGIHLVCNFQRRFEPEHLRLQQKIKADPTGLLSVSGHYMKGLRHIGVTLIDSITALCGLPEAVLAYRRVANAEIGDDSYDFVLFFPGFTASVKTIDSARFAYCYHLFELDLLFAGGRSSLVDISQGIRETPVTDYAYSGVKILNERQAVYRKTGYDCSMVSLMQYAHDVTRGLRAHDVNRPESCYNTALIVDRIVESYDSGSLKLEFGPASWKK